MLGGLHATAEQRASRAARFQNEAAEASSRFAPPKKSLAHPATFVSFSRDKRAALEGAARARLAAGEKLGAAQRATLQSLGVTDDALGPPRKQPKKAKRRAEAAVDATAAAAAALPQPADAKPTGKRRKHGIEDALQKAPAPALSKAERRLLASLS
jgi:hypothetical protein